MNLPTLALLGGVAYALRHIVRNVPQLGVAIGLGLLGLAGYRVASIGRGAFQTEGSPAGTLIAVVWLCAVLAAGMLGLVLIGLGIRNWVARPSAPLSRVQQARVARGLPAEPVLPDCLDRCQVWLTAHACARGALQLAQETDQRGRRAIVVAQDARYLAMLHEALNHAAIPLLAADEFHLNRARDLAATLAVVDVLFVGISRRGPQERALLGLLAKQPTRFEIRHCLSLDDLERAGVQVGRARTAAAALRLLPDEPLTHPMPRQALDEALRRALRA